VEGFRVQPVAEQSVARGEAPTPVRQELDSFGNLVTIFDGTQPLSLTATTLTAGPRASWTLGRVVPSLRAGIGWGRTGGFGRTLTTTTGAIIDGSGQWIPVESRVDIGGGSPASGFAWSGAFSLEAPVGHSIGLFAETAATGLVLRHDHLLMIPLRAGIVLR
jgi:hypothetical protein